MGRYDPDWINILFFIYIDAFRVEKMAESTCRVILVVVPNLGNWGLNLFEAIFRYQMTLYEFKFFLA
jgi:hypothetical protein